MRCPEATRIKHFLGPHQKVWDQLFGEGVSDPDTTRPRTEIMNNTFSSGERIMLKVALDLWSGDGGALITEAFYRLDESAVGRMVEAFTWPLEMLEHASRARAARGLDQLSSKVNS